MPKASVYSWDDLKIKFITQYVGERQFLKDVGCLDDVRQQENESLASYYNRFNKYLANINQVITDGDVVRVFVMDLRCRRKAMGNTFRVAVFYTLGELAERVKAYINLKPAEEHVSDAYVGVKHQKEAPARENQLWSSPPPKKDAWRNDPRPPLK